MYHEWLRILAAKIFYDDDKDVDDGKDENIRMKYTWMK